LQAAGFFGRVEEVVGGIEERGDVATAATGAAVVAGGVAAGGPGVDCFALVDDLDAERFGGAFHEAFAAAQAGRRLMEARAGQRVGVIIAAADADVLLHFVVVGRDVFVANRPRNFPA